MSGGALDLGVLRPPSPRTKSVEKVKSLEERVANMETINGRVESIESQMGANVRLLCLYGDMLNIRQ